MHRPRVEDVESCDEVRDVSVVVRWPRGYEVHRGDVAPIPAATTLGAADQELSESRRVRNICATRSARCGLNLAIAIIGRDQQSRIGQSPEQAAEHLDGGTARMRCSQRASEGSAQKTNGMAVQPIAGCPND